jgi:hypothetical protein
MIDKPPVSYSGNVSRARAWAVITMFLSLFVAGFLWGIVFNRKLPDSVERFLDDWGRTFFTLIVVLVFMWASKGKWAYGRGGPLVCSDDANYAEVKRLKRREMTLGLVFFAAMVIALIVLRLTGTK